MNERVMATYVTPTRKEMEQKEGKSQSEITIAKGIVLQE